MPLTKPSKYECHMCGEIKKYLMPYCISNRNCGIDSNQQFAHGTINGGIDICLDCTIKFVEERFSDMNDFGKGVWGKTLEEAKLKRESGRLNSEGWPIH